MTTHCYITMTETNCFQNYDRANVNIKHKACKFQFFCANWTQFNAPLYSLSDATFTRSLQELGNLFLVGESIERPVTIICCCS